MSGWRYDSTESFASSMTTHPLDKSSWSTFNLLWFGNVNKTDENLFDSYLNWMHAPFRSVASWIMMVGSAILWNVSFFNKNVNIAKNPFFRDVGEHVNVLVFNNIHFSLHSAHTKNFSFSSFFNVKFKKIENICHSVKTFKTEQKWCFVRVQNTHIRVCDCNFIYKIDISFSSLQC